MKVFRNLKFSEVDSNAAGLRSISFLARKADIKAFPTLPDTASVNGGTSTLEGDFVMRPDKTFVQIYTRKGSGKLSFETTGPKDGIFFVEKAELDYPDMDDEALNLARNIINDELVLVVGTRVANSSKFRFAVMGSEMFTCYATPTGSSGTVDSPDDKGLKLEFTSHSITPFARYTGTIITADGTFDCETGLMDETAPAGE